MKTSDVFAYYEYLKNGSKRILDYIDDRLERDIPLKRDIRIADVVNKVDHPITECRNSVSSIYSYLFDIKAVDIDDVPKLEELACELNNNTKVLSNYGLWPIIETT